MFPPVDPTRRRFLTVSAVASVASVGALTAAAMADPIPVAVTIPRHCRPNPAFALIADKRAADIRAALLSTSGGNSNA